MYFYNLPSSYRPSRARVLVYTSRKSIPVSLSIGCGSRARKEMIVGAHDCGCTLDIRHPVLKGGLVFGADLEIAEKT